VTDIWALLGVLSDGLDEMAEAARAEKLRRYNSPAARAARSERSRKAAATRRARAEAARAEEEWRESRIPAGPVCDALGITLQAQEVYCIRTPHRRGDHENIDGNTWPCEDEEFEDMLTVTTTDLRKLLDAQAESPVLYLARDDETGEPVRLEVWAAAHAPDADIIVHRHELVDALGGPDHPDGVTDDALAHLLEGYQNLLAVTIDREPILSDACVDGDGNDYPEHDWPGEGEGYECRRCGAELTSEPDGVYDGEIR
jgi:hypothetical protein